MAGIAERYRHERTLIDALSAKIEMELGELEPDEAAVFMEELGLHGVQPGPRDPAVSYRLLGLISFLTAGPDEVRAWPIPDGSTQLMRRGRSTRISRVGSSVPRSCPTRTSCELGSMAEARKHGKLRSEGKTYAVKDGDVIEILFSR